MPGRVLAQTSPAAPPATSAPRADDAPVAVERQVREDEVTAVRIEGNRRVEAEAIRRALRTQVGAVFDPARTPDDVRAVWALGYFSDVQLLVQHLPSGGIVYVVRVQERPSIHAVKLDRKSVV